MSDNPFDALVNETLHNLDPTETLDADWVKKMGLSADDLAALAAAMAAPPAEENDSEVIPTAETLERTRANRQARRERREANQEANRVRLEKLHAAARLIRQERRAANLAAWAERSRK